MVLRVIVGFLGGAVVGSGVVIAASQLLPPVEIKTPPPQSGEVAVPAGSAFNAELPDTAPVLPQTEGRPSDSTTPLAAQPDSSASVSVDTRPASTPEAGSIETAMAAPVGSTAPVVETGSDSGVTANAAQPSQPGVDAAPSAVAPIALPETDDTQQAGLAPPTGENAPVSVETGQDASPSAEVAVQPGQPASDTAPVSDAPSNAPEAGNATTSIAAPAGQVDTAPLPVPDTPAGPGLATPKIDDLSPGTNEALPRIGAEPETPADVAAEPALTKHAEAFKNTGGNPLLALVLIETADGGASADLKDFPTPLTVAIDPTTAGAGARMAELRAAGVEVGVLAPLPDGATPADVEVAFQSFFTAVPQSVAVIDMPEALLQANRPRASQVVEILKETGHGLVTYEKGLNAALQIADSKDVRATTVFRVFDDGEKNVAAMKRFLDQGAFRAGQVGPVILVGQLRAETLAAIAEWSLGNRAATVALAPVSAVLQKQ